jgi:hypothetical protein
MVPVVKGLARPRGAHIAWLAHLVDDWMETWGVNTSSSMSMLGMSIAMALLTGTCRKRKLMAASCSVSGFVAAVAPSSKPVARSAPLRVREVLVRERPGPAPLNLWDNEVMM